MLLVQKFLTLNNYMSSEVHKYIEASLKRKQNILNAQVINFPNEKKENIIKNLSKTKNDYWNISDKSNIDQLKAVNGICFMLGALVLMGLYSNLS